MMSVFTRVLLPEVAVARGRRRNSALQNSDSNLAARSTRLEPIGHKTLDLAGT
jgi:hypothetical protein